MEAEIRKLVGSDKLIIGSDRVLKGIKNNELSKVILAANAPEMVKEKVKYYQKIAGFEVYESELDNTELGTLCKKPFPIASLGVKN